MLAHTYATAQVRALWWHHTELELCVIGSLGFAFDIRRRRLRVVYVGPGVGFGSRRIRRDTNRKALA